MFKKLKEKLIVHIPVLQKEVIKYLEPKPNENFIDCTINGGGHALAILEETAPKGRLLGIDWDKNQILNLKSQFPTTKFRSRLILVCDNFVNLKEIVKKQNFKQVQGIIFDLGLSSWHLEKSGRGFSFLRNEPLDMRYNPENPLTAEKIVNYWSEPEIERILKEYGEERYARKIAKEIVKERKLKPIKTTQRLVTIIRNSIPLKYQHFKIHFATRTFQALRIAVNSELENLKIVLPQTLEILKKGGRLVIISFHSLEDRIVKNFFRERFLEGKLEILTKKPIIPNKKEIKINPRSRSAKLRAIKKI